MKTSCIYLLICSILKLCVSLEHVWHSYQYDPVHENREELVITNITSDNQFKMDYEVTRWKSICVEKACYAAGLMEKNVAIASIKLNSDKDGFSQQSNHIELKEKPVDVAIFQHQNKSSDQVIVVIATEKPELLWYIIEEAQNSLFWFWSMQKNISHLNIFQIKTNYQILVITKFGTETTGDLYEFELNSDPNFWLRQKIRLLDQATTSTVTSVGPNYFLAVPQKSLNTLYIYKFKNDHFESFKNLTSDGIDKVVSFKTSYKSFLAFNGFNAGIYRFTQSDLIREKIANSHLDAVNYWLPMSVTANTEDTFLIAQRSLEHTPHKSFVIEIITYNGDKFEEHEDIPCLYFGESTLGLSCLPGEESGIIGATSISLDNVLGLLIPRKKSFSELFLIHFDVKKNSNPVQLQLEKLIQERQNLDILIIEQEKQYKEIANRRQAYDLNFMKAQLKEMEKDLDLMKESLKGPTHYKSIVFNSLVVIQGDGMFEEVEVNTIKKELANNVLQDIVLRDNMTPILSPKIFKNLEIEELNFENVNNISAQKILFNTDNITVNNNLVLEKQLIINQDAIADELNGKIFESEVVDLNSPVDELVFESVEVYGDVKVDKINSHPHSLKIEDIKTTPEKMEIDTLHVPYNIIVENVNNENFNQFLEQLCLRNIKTFIPGDAKIDGDIAVKGNAQIDYLNEIKFPQEYVFTDNSFPNITGQKTFATSLITSAVSCEGAVDDLHTSKIITLSTDQNVSGTTTFKKLKVTESLDVAGNVLGEDANKFLPNPVLLESELVKANVNFKELEVEGEIILMENFNGENFELLLSDIVYANEEEAVIEAMKQFSEGLTVRKNLIIDSNTISGVNLNSIVTKDTDQVLNVTTLRGIVNFNNVNINGSYDSVDIRDLDEQIVKLDGEQYISSTLIFEDDLNANELEIFETINDLDQDQFLSATSTQFEDSIDTDILHLENITVEGNIFGEIDGFDLENFERRRLTFAKDQVIEADYIIKDSSIEQMQPVHLNNMDFYKFTRDSILDNMKKELRNGNRKVENLHVRGSVFVDRINNQPTTNLGGALWKNNANNDNLNNLTFNEDTYFNNIQIESLSRVNFSRFINSIVFKDETNPKIAGRKIFLEGITVKKLIETEKLNNITLSNILTKQGVQEIVGPITIHGNASFDNNITVNENINDMLISLITDNYQIEDDQFQIKGDILFSRLPHIFNLQIQGHVNGKLAQKIIGEIVYKEGDLKLDGLTTFENNVDIEGNIRVINKTNNIDLAGFVSNMVMTTKDTEIKSSVTFKEFVVVQNHITLSDDLKTRTVNGIDLNSWTENAIFVNKGYLKGNYMMEEVEIVDKMYTDYINNINVNTLIQLRTQQNITELSFEEISTFNDIVVENSTNFHNLSKEFDNTVLTSPDQEINSDIEFLGNVFIEGDLEVSGLINDMDTKKIVTTTTNQNLSAVYNFKGKVVVEKDIQVQGLVNGIDMTAWWMGGVKTRYPLPQNITDNWDIQQDLVFEDEASGGGLINGLDFQQFRQEIEDKRNYKYAVEKGFIDDYLNICKDLTYMYDKLKTQIYKFNYLEKLQEMSFLNKIQDVYHFQHGNDFYLLINEEKHCESHLFIFSFRFRFVKSVAFGFISQIISVRDNNLIYFVVRSQPVCDVHGTNLWQLIDDNFVRFANIENQDLLQESVLPGTFYGIRGHIVTEFKISAILEHAVAKYRKWEVKEENIAFVPRGLSTGLALRTGKKLIRLNRDDPAFNDFNYETETVIRGNLTEEFNTYLPGRKESDLVVMKVGIKSSKRSLLAVASHEETSVKGSLDFIKIYEDAVTGKVFHKIPTYKPSSLVAVEFNNGETLMAFMEDESVLQVYEYKGIGGFKHKLSAKLEGSKLFTMTLQLNKRERHVLGLIDKNRISFTEAVMLGNQVEQNLQCSL